MTDLLEIKPEIDGSRSRIIVRLTRVAWHNKGRYELKVRLTLLKRRSWLVHNILEEDSDNVGALETLEKVTNLHSADEGVYELNICNEQRDWETGLVDDYDYRLDRVHDMIMAALRMPDGRIIALPRPARHSDLFVLLQKNGVAPADQVKPNIVQGFMRDDKRFVDRQEATVDVKRSYQNRKPLLGHLVTSEDLW